MSAWLLIFFVANVPTFTLTVQAESKEQCEKIAHHLDYKFASAKHVCLDVKKVERGDMLKS